MGKFKDMLQNEKQDEEVILQALANKDINAKIENNVVLVDKDDVKGAQKVLKEIGCNKKVKAGLNESNYSKSEIEKMIKTTFLTLAKLQEVVDDKDYDSLAKSRRIIRDLLDRNKEKMAGE